MILLGTGGRNHPRFRPFYETYFLNSLHRIHQFRAVYHGAAPGADTEIGVWAALYNLPIQAFPAEWEKYGRAAGPRRNREMLYHALLTGSDVLCVAFPGGNGTANMIEICKESDVRVIRYTGERL